MEWSMGEEEDDFRKIRRYQGDALMGYSHVTNGRVGVVSMKSTLKRTFSHVGLRSGCLWLAACELVRLFFSDIPYC